MNAQINSQKKHIDIITKYFYPIAGGIENNIMQTYVTLQNTFGWDVTVHTTRDTYTEKNILVPNEIVNSLRVKRYESGIFGFKPDINWKTTDVVALHNFDIFFMRYLFLSFLLKILNKKRFVLILTPHGGFSPEWSMFSPVSRFVKKIYTHTLGAWLINATVDGVRAVSEWERLEEVKYIVPKKVHLIDNGLEDEAYSDIDALASSNVKKVVQGYGRYIIQVARVYPIKNIETSIRALAHLPEDIKFVVVGQLQDAEYEKKLKTLITELNLEDRVIFIGVVRGVDKYYLMRHAIAMVHMALWESGCNVVREGMSQGLPCVVSNTYGLPGLVKDEVNGFCLPVHDEKKVSEKVKWILNTNNSEKVKKIKEVNVIFGKGQSWRKVASRMNKMYRECIVNNFVYNNKNKGILFSIFIHLRNTVYSVSGFLNYIFPNSKPKIVVYCYHSVSDDGWRFSVTKNNFEKQIGIILKDQVPLSTHELSLYINGEKKLTKNSFVITFDDGYEDILHVKDFLSKHNISPTVFVLSDTEKANRKELETGRAFLSLNQLKGLKESGWGIGSHSATHPDFTNHSCAKMLEEISGSKIKLEEKLGFSVDYFSYPKSVYNKEIIKIVSEAGYTLAFSLDDGYVGSKTDRFLVPRVGVDGTHILQQFVYLALPFSMFVRKILKKFI